MLIRILYLEQASIIAAVVCSLIVAGLLKGIIGVGMPIVALPLLSLFIDVKSAAMLLSMPLILSNLPQALEGGKTGRLPHAIDAGDSRHDFRALPWSSSPVGARCERCKDYRRPCADGCRRRHAARAEAAASRSLGFTNRHHIRIFRRDSGRHRSDAGTACFHISACKGTARKGVHKGSIAVSRRFRRLAGNSSDGQPPVQLARRFSLDGCDVASRARHVRRTTYAR